VTQLPIMSKDLDPGRQDEESETAREGYGAKQLAHTKAQQRCLEDYISPGETIEVFVQTSPRKNGGEEAVGSYSRDEVQDVRVFIDPGPHQLPRGSRVRCKVRHCGDTFLKALAM